MKSIATRMKGLFPGWIYRLARGSYRRVICLRLRVFGRPAKRGETSKARARRISEGFFEKYCSGRGIDIGYGGDPVVDGCRCWDFEHGDAQYLEVLRDEAYDFAYSSHALEDVDDPAVALRNWWRVVAPGGYLILYLPSRNLYEKKKTLPSVWNDNHRRFFLLEEDDPPDTVSVMRLVRENLPGCHVVYAKECSSGMTVSDPDSHSDGEYSFEIVLRKPGREAGKDVYEGQAESGAGQS